MHQSGRHQALNTRNRLYLWKSGRLDISLFDYTSPRLNLIKEYQKRVKEELLRVKSLKINNRKSKWVENHQSPDEYHDDDVSRLPRIGLNTKTHQSLNKLNIKTIMDMKAIPVDNLPPIRGIEALHYKAHQHSLPGQSPNKLVDHRLVQNPYESKYGEK